MRDFNDYKAEIFRRSEEKIKERKKNRNRILAFCVPICLVFAAVAFTKLPDISASDISTENISSDSSVLFSQVKVQNASEKLHSNALNVDAEEASEIYSLIQSAFEADVQKEEDTADDYRYTSTSGTVIQDTLSVFSDSKYEIVFTSKDGKTFSYTLDGNKLIDNTTNENVTLSSEQVFKLQSKLGLIIKWEEE